MGLNEQEATISRILREHQKLERIAELQVKLAEGETLNRSEIKDYEEYERDLMARVGMRFIANCPRTIYLEQTGRAPRTINAMADTYELPLRGSYVDLWVVLRRFHDILAENANLLAAERKRGDSTEGFMSKLDEERYRKMVDEREARQGNLVSKEIVSDMFVAWGAKFRGLGQRLAKRFGNDALDMLNDTLADCAIQTETILGDGKRKRK